MIDRKPISVHVRQQLPSRPRNSNPVRNHRRRPFWDPPISLTRIHTRRGRLQIHTYVCVCV